MCRIAIAGECLLGEKAFANVFAGSFFRFAWHFLQNSMSVSSEEGIFILKTATLGSCVATKTTRSVLVG
jgi:hypothetical protein